MILLALFILLDCLIFQPIRLVMGILFKLTWTKRKVSHISKLHTYSYDLNVDSKFKDKLKTFNLDNILKSGDCAKFLGMYYVATHNELVWNEIMKLFYVNRGTILRRPWEYQDVIDEPEFSTDMYSGIILALWERYRIKGFTMEEKRILSSVWDNIAFNGLPVNVPDREGKKYFKRGMIYKPFIFWSCDKIPTLLTFLKLGSILSGDIKSNKMKIAYNAFYYATLILLFPSLLLASSDGNILLSRFYYMAAHNAHSEMLIYATGYDMTKSFIFKHVFMEHYRRQKEYNADVLALFSYFKMNKDNNSVLSEEDNEVMRDLLCSVLDKGTREYIHDTTVKYLSINWPPLVTRYKDPVYPSYRNNDYSWERNPIKTSGLLDDAYRNDNSLDFIFPASLYLRSNKNSNLE